MGQPGRVAAAGRQAAARLMTDACEIRAESTFVFNPVTKADDETPGVLVYAGPCRVRMADAVGGEVPAGDAAVGSWSALLSIPFAATHNGVPAVVGKDHVVTVTASADATLVGQRMRVTRVPQGTHLTARRITCEVLAG